MVGAGQGTSSPTTDWGEGRKRGNLGRKHLLEELAGLRRLGRALLMLEGSSLLGEPTQRSDGLIKSGTLKLCLQLHIPRTLASLMLEGSGLR